MTNTLAARCDEILLWRTTGTYEGHVLQEFADALVESGKIKPDDDYLRAAEALTVKEALELVADGAMPVTPAGSDISTISGSEMRHILQDAVGADFSVPAAAAEKASQTINRMIVDRYPSIARLQSFVEMLDETRRQLTYLDERWPTGTTPAIIARITALLSSKSPTNLLGQAVHALIRIADFRKGSPMADDENALSMQAIAASAVDAITGGDTR